LSRSLTSGVFLGRKRAPDRACGVGCAGIVGGTGSCGHRRSGLVHGSLNATAGVTEGRDRGHFGLFGVPEGGDAQGDPIFASTVSETREASNVIADTKEGREDCTVIVGAHLDSVPEGPGINDNGSGSATVLEIAEKMSELGIEPQNRVRFAFWGAEELGLFGSKHYVAQLDERQLGDIAVYLNFDMVASPNYVRFIYGSGEVRKVFKDFFASRGLKTETVDLKGAPTTARSPPRGSPWAASSAAPRARRRESRPRSTVARRASPTTGATTRPATT
jgi:acetylornithine deacetylase/succinyl-diaminopimelate desuccinylase-like protein